MMENTTPVSTSALLLALKNIENNTEVNNKAQIPTMTKRAEGKSKMNLSNPVKPKKGGWTTKYCSH